MEELAPYLDYVTLVSAALLAELMIIYLLDIVGRRSGD